MTPLSPDLHVALDVESESALPPPPNPMLPLFVYGIFKPGELAFERLRESVMSHEPATISGSLWIRDGLPLFAAQQGGEVQGIVLRFEPEHAVSAYATVCEVEPPKLYKWTEARLQGIGEAVNVLAGIGDPRSWSGLGATRSDEGQWTWTEDRVFSDAISVVSQVAAIDGQDGFESAPPDHFAWERYFRLQMAYLLLWSAIERFTALKFGAAVDPMKRVSALGGDQAFRDAFSQEVRRQDTVADSRSRRRVPLEACNPLKGAIYYYQIRNNLSHRGKGAYAEGEKVRHALLELLAIFKRMISTYGGG